MRKNSFSIIEFFSMIIVIGLIAIIVAPSVSKYLEPTELTTFAAFENNIESSAKDAVLKCISSSSSKCLLPDKDNFKDIKVSYLIEEGFIDYSKVSKNGKCDIDKSFVRVENKGNLNYKFKVCFYCEGYTTDNNIC